MTGLKFRISFMCFGEMYIAYLSPFLCVNKVGCKNMNAKKNNDKRSDIKDRTIARQAKEIESLKTKISKLESICNEKDAIIAAKENESAEFAASIESLRSELKANVGELKQKSEEYDENLAEIKRMKKVFNEELFKGRWNLVRLLVK